MSPTTNYRRQRRTEYHFYAEIVADITTQNSERKHTTQKTKKSNTDPILFKIDIKYTNITQAFPKCIK